MKSPSSLATLASVSLAVPLAASFAAPVPGGFINVADFAPSDGSADASAAIQRLIDGNPNRTLWFADGTYLLEKPVCTPADPRLSVDLRLSNYAVLKAAPEWAHNEAMVRLGGIHPANDIRTVGSVYSLSGGIIDGSGVAKGVSIDSGRETVVRNVSMKFVSVGLHIRRGVNGGSSDCDISGVNIVGNKRPGSIGVLVDGSDNTLSNMRIADVQTGVRLVGSGNLMTNLHPLYTNPMEQYAESVAFHDLGGNNSYDRCENDHFSTGWLFTRDWCNAVLTGCLSVWYAQTPGFRHTAIRCEGMFGAHVSDMAISWCGAEAVNTVLEVGADGGAGYFRSLMVDQRLVNEGRKAYLDYLR